MEKNVNWSGIVQFILYWIEKLFWISRQFLNYNIKIMKSFFYNLTVTLIFSIVFGSCGDKNDSPDEPDSNEHARKRTVLVYAVASNNLYSNLLDDKEEMLLAAENMNLDGLSMLVYEVTRYGEPTLSEIVKSETGECEFEVIKTYDKSLYSTDPKRISQVFSDVATEREANSYGLVLWSHGTGLDPSFSTHATRGDGNRVDYLPGVFSFGSDNDKDKDSSYYDEIDIDELADAIPDGMFSFIWFDACYMSGIETIYELRSKCEYFVGYPTEVFTPGMPYHLTLPYILRENPDLVGGAKAFFNYYADYPSSNMQVATIAVVDMSKIERVADYCKRAYSQISNISTSGLLCYTRGKIGPFYDFGQYTRLRAGGNDDAPATAEFDNAMSELVVWCNATPTDFNYRPIDKEIYSGISCHLYDPSSSTDKANYYKTLDWFKRVY